MPSKRSFEEQVAALDAVRQEPEEARLVPLRKALAHRNNFIAAKAADLVRDFRMAQLTPELADRFRSLLSQSGEDRPAVLGQERAQPRSRCARLSGT